MKPDILDIIQDALYQFVDDYYELESVFEISREEGKLKILNGKHRWEIQENFNPDYTT